MTTDDWQRISAIFHEARALSDEQRTAYIDEACGADGALRARVERLLAAERRAGSFGEEPIVSREQAAAYLDGVEAAAEGGIGARDASATPSASGAPGASRASEASVRPTGRRRPFLTFAFLAAAATLLTFAYAAWLLVAGAGVAPQFGWEAVPQGDEWQISRIATDGPAAGILLEGDRLLLMNETAPGPDAALLLHRRDLAPGDTYVLSIERAGERRDLELSVGERPNTTQLIYYFVSLVWCAVGLFIGFARPEAALARLACMTSLAVGFVFLQISVIQSGLLWQPLHAVLGYHFLARFPTGQLATGYQRAGLMLAYLTGGFAAALGLVSHGTAIVLGTRAAIEFLNDWAALFGLRWPFSITAFAISVAGMLLALYLNYRRITSEDHRRRIRWVLYGALVGLAPQVWWTIVTIADSIAGPTPLPRFDLLVNGSTVAIPLTMAYAVVRHRVLDIRVVVRRSLQYLLAQRALQATMTLPFLALIAILIRNRDLTLNELATETYGYVIWLALAGLALKYRSPIALWLDRRFFREELDREQLMMSLLDDSRRVESLSELSQLVSVTLAGAMHPSSALVWYRDPRERMETAASIPELSAADFPAREDFLRWLEQQGSAISLPMLELAGISPETVSWLESRGIALIVPMADSGDRLVGALFLGTKKSEEPYDAKDSKLLDAIARQTAVMRENLHLRARLSDEVRVRHDVLSRLGDQLPDLLKECPVCGVCFGGSEERCTHDDEPLVLTLPVARTVDDRYRLERVLGKGGMGAVYEARDLRLKRDVAVKVLLNKGLRQAGALRRFRREAHATARLSHPNIVTIYDFGSLEGEIAYIVMERVPGETLRTTLEREGPLGLGAVQEWFGPILTGISTAHDEGIVHRDLKPENVMGMREGDGRLEVKILDLGLAKLRAQEQADLETMTQEGLVMGTPDYMSPEQLLGREVDQRSDIFAIGIMLIEALTGQRVRRGGLRGESALQIDLPENDLPPALAELLRRSVAVDPDERPASAEILAEELATCAARAEQPGLGET